MPAHWYRCALCLALLPAVCFGQLESESRPEARESLELAEEYDSAGAANKAIGAYRYITRYYPFTKEAERAQFRIAEILQAQGNLNKAFDAYQTLITKYPNSPQFDEAVAAQITIANDFLRGRRITLLGFAVLNSIERTQEMYKKILASAPYSRQAPVAQFNLGLAYEQQGEFAKAVQAYQTVLDNYPNSDVCDDAHYQIAYVYMRQGLTGKSRDLSALVQARETFQDFLIEYPRSEKVAQAEENLREIGQFEADDLLRIAQFYDRSRDYRAAVIYYNDVVRRQPATPDAEIAKARVDELRTQFGEDALRTGPEKAETGERLAQRRRAQAEVESSALSNYQGPPRSDIVADELPAPRTRLRSAPTDIRPLPPVEPALPTE